MILAEALCLSTWENQVLLMGVVVKDRNIVGTSTYNILHSLPLNFLMKILLGDEFIHEMTGNIKHSP